MESNSDNTLDHYKRSTKSMESNHGRKLWHCIYLLIQTYANDLHIEHAVQNQWIVYYESRGRGVDTLWQITKGKREIFVPVSFSLLSPLLSVAEFKTCQIAMFHVVSLETSVSGRIQDGAKSFTNCIRAKKHERPCIQITLAKGRILINNVSEYLPEIYQRTYMN